MTELTTIDFHGAKLVAIGGDSPESVRVAMKPIVEGMGLDWSGQLQRIKRHPVLSRGMGVLPIQMPGDDQARETVTLPLNRIAERRALSRSSRSAIVFDAGAKKAPVRISSRHIGARSTRHGKARFGAFFYGRTYGRAQWGAVRLAVCSMRSANPLSPGHQGSSLRSGSLRNGAPQ